MNIDPSSKSNSELLWKRYLDAYDEFLAAGREFNSMGENKVNVLRVAFANDESRLALQLAESLKPEEQIELFSELLGLATYSHGRAGHAQNIILSLPREWIKSNIESYAEPLVNSGDYETYWGLLALYLKIDLVKTKKLAERAVSSPDKDIQDAGQYFLDKLKSE